MLQNSVDASRCAVSSSSSSSCCCSTSSDSLRARRCGPIITPLRRRRQKRRSDGVVGNSSGVGQDRFDVALTGREEETDTKKKKRTVSLDLGGNQKQTTVIEYSGELVAVEIERPLGLVLEESLEGAELQALGEEVTQNLAIGSQFSNNFTQLIVVEDEDDNEYGDEARMLGTTAVNSSTTDADAR